MRYNPREAVSCLPEGEYLATIVKGEETTSKSGKDMIVLSYRVHTPSGNTYELKDYIVKESLWKLKRLSAAIGQEKAFESGEFNPGDYVERNLTLVLAVESDPEFGDKNKVKAYKPKGLSVVGATSGYTPPPDGDNIPF